MSRNTIIVITGCSRGLGRALLETYAKRGFTVYGCARCSERIDTLRSELDLGNALSVLDVTDSSAVEQWASNIIKQHGAPDYVLNNAALINENVPFWEVPTEDFDRIIDVNLKGVANVARAFLPAMIREQSGVLINFSSGYGHFAAPGVAPYCCTKFGIEGLTQAIAKELPQGVSAIPMSPGIINTDMLQTTFGSENAAAHEAPSAWAQHAADYILTLSVEHNGQSLRVPQP